MRRVAAVGTLAALALLLPVLAGCGGSGSAAPSSSPVVPVSSSAAPVASPSGPATPTSGESATAFWARRQVSPPPPTTFLDAYAGLALPTVRGSVPDAKAYVTAALRQTSGETYAIDHLRLDLVESGVLGTAGLSGDDTSIIQARNAGLSGTTTTLSSVAAASVVRLTAAQATGLDAYVVVLRLQYGPLVGTFADGTSKTLPATGPQTQALAGHLVTSPLLGTYFFVTSAVDCASATKGSASAAACATLS